jgi:uncharacterized protein with HEPN domain
MKKRDPIVYILDMLDFSNSALTFIQGFTYKLFTEDEKTLFAVIRAIEIIGEASKKLPKHLKEKYPDTPWREIAGMRDKVIHEYFGVDKKVVWHTVKQDLPKLKKHLEIILKDLNYDQKLNFK